MTDNAPTKIHGHRGLAILVGAKMKLSGHVIGLLKEYMRDLVEQAAQEASTQQSFGFTPAPYRPDQAVSDLLAILDDRIESEGIQVGLPDGFLHHMWAMCNEAQTYITDRVWLESNVGERVSSKANTRELTYRTLIEYIEKHEGPKE
jgi:hypothetical protein